MIVFTIFGRGGLGPVQQIAFINSGKDAVVQIDTTLGPDRKPPGISSSPTWPSDEA